MGVVAQPKGVHVVAVGWLTVVHVLPAQTVFVAAPTAVVCTGATSGKQGRLLPQNGATVDTVVHPAGPHAVASDEPGYR